MAQDFAKQRSIPDPGKRRRAVSKTPPPANTNWSWFFSGLMSGVIVSIAAYLGMLKLEEGAVEEAQPAQATGGTENQPTYSFYEVLTQAEVAVKTPEAAIVPVQPAETTPANASPATTLATTTSPDTATPANTAPATPQTAAVEAKPDLYLLQAGSYQNQRDAENQRARIILLNLNANISEGIVGGRTHYRVQVGPFAGRQNADAARTLLAGNDIESIFLKVAQ